MDGQERRTRVGYNVGVSLPDLDRDERKRLGTELHRADRRLGVIVGSGRFVLLTDKSDEQKACEYTRAIMVEAAEQAGISTEVVAQAPIIEVERRVRDITGKPRHVTARAGEYRTLDLGARGRLRALYQGALGDWIVELDGRGAWAGRALSSVLDEVFELPWGRKDQWVHDLVAELEGRHTALGLRYPCPCCDMLTLIEPTSSGSFESCPVCQWENDRRQLRDLDYEGGPNGPSLRQARESYAQTGASQPRRAERTRAPLPNEFPALPQ